MALKTKILSTARTLVLIALAAVPFMGFTAEPSGLYRFELEDLSSFSTYNTGALDGRTSLWVLFQPNCASCKTQLKNLSCLSKDIEKIAVGIHGGRDQLNAALRPLGFTGRKLMASRPLEKLLDTELTPTLYLVDRSGNARRTIQGLVSCETLRTALSKIL